MLNHDVTAQLAKFSFVESRKIASVSIVIVLPFWMANEEDFVPE